MPKLGAKKKTSQEKEMTFIEMVGWVGNIPLALCAIPQAHQSYTNGHSRGINTKTLYLWFLGEFWCLIYVLYLLDAPLILNYATNFLALLVILYYHRYERDQDV